MSLPGFLLNVLSIQHALHNVAYPHLNISQPCVPGGLCLASLEFHSIVHRFTFIQRLKETHTQTSEAVFLASTLLFSALPHKFQASQLPPNGHLSSTQNITMFFLYQDPEKYLQTKIHVVKLITFLVSFYQGSLSLGTYFSTHCQNWVSLTILTVVHIVHLEGDSTLFL